MKMLCYPFLCAIFRFASAFAQGPDRATSTNPLPRQNDISNGLVRVYWSRNPPSPPPPNAPIANFQPGDPPSADQIPTDNSAVELPLPPDPKRLPPSALEFRLVVYMSGSLRERVPGLLDQNQPVARQVCARYGNALLSWIATKGLDTRKASQTATLKGFTSPEYQGTCLLKMRAAPGAYTESELTRYWRAVADFMVAKRVENFKLRFKPDALDEDFLAKLVSVGPED